MLMSEYLQNRRAASLQIPAVRVPLPLSVFDSWLSRRDDIRFPLSSGPTPDEFPRLKVISSALSCAISPYRLLSSARASRGLIFSCAASGRTVNAQTRDISAFKRRLGGEKTFV